MYGRSITEVTEGGFRVDYVRDLGVHWRGHARVVHLSSGLVEEFDISWDDGGGIERAKERLLARLGGDRDDANS